MPGRVSLEVVAGPIQGRQFQFDGHDTFLFGRSPDCHAELSQDDSTASRHHFILEVNPPAARLRDLGSLNGTYVNGQKYGGRARNMSPEEGARQALAQVDIRDGDTIRVGATVFTVRVEGVRTPTPVAAMSAQVGSSALLPLTPAENLHPTAGASRVAGYVLGPVVG